MLFISCISKDSKLNYIKLDSPLIENTVSPSMSVTQKDITDHNQICPCLGVQGRVYGCLQTNHSSLNPP